MITNISFNFQFDSNVPSSLAADAYLFSASLDRKIIMPDGSEVFISDETRSSFVSPEDKNTYIKNTVSIAAASFAEETVRNYASYLEKLNADYEEISSELARRYIQAWVSDVDLDLRGAFCYEELVDDIEMERVESSMTSDDSDELPTNKAFDGEDFDSELETQSEYLQRKRRERLEELKRLKK